MECLIIKVLANKRNFVFICWMCANRRFYSHLSDVIAEPDNGLLRLLKKEFSEFLKDTFCHLILQISQISLNMRFLLRYSFCVSRYVRRLWGKGRWFMSVFFFFLSIEEIGSDLFPTTPFLCYTNKKQIDLHNQLTQLASNFNDEPVKKKLRSMCDICWKVDKKYIFRVC